MTDITTTLAERGTRYGDFPGHAKITQGLKRTMRASPKWGSLTDQQREALEMVAHKIGRILNGDPNYHDSWHDIIGYTKLVADELAEDTPKAVRQTDEQIEALEAEYWDRTCPGDGAAFRLFARAIEAATLRANSLEMPE